MVPAASVTVSSSALQTSPRRRSLAAAKVKPRRTKAAAFQASRATAGAPGDSDTPAPRREQDFKKSRYPQILPYKKLKTPSGHSSPHFSPAFYCGGVSGHVYCVALHRAPRRTVEYASQPRACWMLMSSIFVKPTTKLSGAPLPLRRVGSSAWLAVVHP